MYTCLFHLLAPPTTSSVKGRLEFKADMDKIDIDTIESTRIPLLAGK